MLRKQLKLSLGLLLVFILAVSLMGRSNSRSWMAEAAGDHSSHETHGGVSEHGSAGHGTGGDSHGGGGHHEVETQLLTPDVSWQGWLPLMLTFFSLFTAVLIIVFRSNQQVRSFISVGTAVGSFGLILLMFEPVVTGITIHGHAYKGIAATFPLFLGFDATFKVDPAALVVAGVTVFLWILSTIHWLSYKNVEDPTRHVRYETMVLASLAMNMGVLMSGDFLTLFFFFEGMVIFPYSLIAHKEDPGAMKGANMYLRLGCATSLSLLFGVLLLQHFTGIISIQPLGVEINAMVPDAFKYIIAALMIIGFGGKAGLFFEHAWLPNAHPVAPTPASCLLSGAMIKAGAYGIFRVVNMIFIPPDWGATLQWVTARHIGYAVIWVGIVTMFMGVLNALISANSKRMLAYHSVSQMGYIVMGMGVAAYLGADGAMGLAGSIYHIVNHALFKASLFLTVGAVYYRTHELDMYKLGGLWRNMPFTCVAMFIAACGIAGIPGFNGFASKTLLHHSILEAYEHSAHYAANGLPDFKLKIAEIIFMITAGGTFASNMKLWVLDFLGERQEKHKDIEPAPTSMKVALGLVSASILFIGLNPNWMLETIIGPALAYFHFNPSSHPYHVIYNTHVVDGLRSTIPLLYNPVNFDFLSNSEVVHNLLGGGDAVILGGTTFILGMRFGWFHSEVPDYLSVVWYYKNIFHAFKRICQTVFTRLDAAYNSLWESLIFDSPIATEVVDSIVNIGLWNASTALDRKYDAAIDRIIYSKSMMAVVSELSMEDKKDGVWEGIDKLDAGYNKRIDKFIFSSGVRSLLKDEKDLSPDEKEIWDELSSLEDQYGNAFDKAIFGHRMKALIEGEEQDTGLWGELSRLDEQYGKAFDKAIFGHRMKALIGIGKEKEKIDAGEKEIWDEMSRLDEHYGKAFDKAIFGHRMKALIGGDDDDEKDQVDIDSEIWQELGRLEKQYGKAFDKAIFGQRMKALIEGGEDEEEVLEKLKQLNEKFGDSFDDITLSKIQSLIKQTKEKEPLSARSRLWKRFSEFDSLSYDTSLDKLLFGNIDPSAKPQENWFDRFCRNLSSIHSGDISHYIGWIIIVLAIVMTILIGRFYIASTASLLLLITLIIFAVILTSFLSKE